jgi:hypothetical protein
MTDTPKIDTDELAEWLLRQLRAEETRLLAVIYLARTSDPEHATLVYAAKRKIRNIECARTQIHDNDLAVMRQIADRYSDQPGYRDEWPPAR